MQSGEVREKLPVDFLLVLTGILGATSAALQFLQGMIL